MYLQTEKKKKVYVIYFLFSHVLRKEKNKDALG